MLSAIVKPEGLHIRCIYNGLAPAELEASAYPGEWQEDLPKPMFQTFFGTHPHLTIMKHTRMFALPNWFSYPILADRVSVGISLTSLSRHPRRLEDDRDGRNIAAAQTTSPTTGNDYRTSLPRQQPQQQNDSSTRARQGGINDSNNTVNGHGHGVACGNARRPPGIFNRLVGPGNTKRRKRHHT